MLEGRTEFSDLYFDLLKWVKRLKLIIDQKAY